MIMVQNEHFDIEKIADSGQCFRLNKTAQNKFTLVAHGHVLLIDAVQGGAVLHCTQGEYNTLWRDYFDLETPYAGFCNAVPKEDVFLTEAVQYGRGIRILQQDAWEMLVTFIISQRKNIPAIKRAVELLCAAAGECLTDDAQPCFAFPTAERMAAMPTQMFAACALGYRTPYLQAAAQMAACGTLNLAALAQADDETLFHALLSVPGVGPKVASCVMLFGYHRLSGFPRDVWINRVIDDEYHGDFPLAHYAGFEGVIQQYMFYYGRSAAYRAMQIK